MPGTINAALRQAAVLHGRQKRGAFAEALAPAMADAAGDIMKNVGEKLVEGATHVLTAGKLRYIAGN